MLRLPIYMDNHATTRVDPRVLECMTPFFTETYGNAASSSHSFGTDAAAAVQRAREQVARLLNTDAKCIVFTSGATEANNLALKGVLQAAEPGSHLITSAAEHRAILDPARALERSGCQLTFLPVDQHAAVDPADVAGAIGPDTVLVSIMLANNEVGTLNHVAEIGRICRDRNVLFHCDAAQAAGRLTVDLAELPVDLVSLSAHKMYGPKGIGALYVRRREPRVPIEPQIEGGGHERRLRSGTLPVPLVVGFGAACEMARESLDVERERIRSLRDRLWQGLQASVDGVHLNGDPDRRLPGNLNVSFENVDGDALMTSLKDVAVSSGSACTSADPEPSHVLRAMGCSEELTQSSLRFGLGRFNTTEEVDFAVSAVAQTVERLRSLKQGSPANLC
jgi:cysteine desulfurase